MELLHESGEVIAERYRILDALGQGGSGTTYLVEDLKTSQQVALKGLSLHRMTEWKMMELFEREARILSGLNHSAIPSYLDYFQLDTPTERYFYIAQQLAEGKSLAAWVESGWHATEEEVRRIAIQILEILVYLHSQSTPVIHRDIKPQNIIRREDGQVFLVDFGAVQDTYYNTFMRGSTVVGTYGYMAPEQFRGQAVPATDLYGLGATLLFLLTHRSPADLPTDRLKIDFRDRVQLASDFAEWLEKMLEPDTENRFPSAKAALAMLRGTRILAAKSKPAVAWKALLGVGIVTVAAVSLLKPFKYHILSAVGITPSVVYSAARRGEINTVRHYLEQGVDVNSRGDYNITPLHEAGSLKVAELLIAKGADVNAMSYIGGTPLHWAIIKGKNDVVKLLIANGANVNAKNIWGYTALHIVVEKGKKKGLIELLIAKGANVNAKNNFGYTPLHLAVKNGTKKDVVKLLIAKGANVNADNNSGVTPLLLAKATKAPKEVIELLKSHGAK